MIERWWRNRRLSRRSKAYLKLEDRMAQADDREAFEWVSGNWSVQLVAAQPTWVLETRPLMKPGTSVPTMGLISAELNRRCSSRALKDARLSLVVSAISMLIALAAWLVK